MALWGAYEGSKPNSDNLKMNLLFTMSNTFSVIYFGFIGEWAYMFRNLVFWCIGILGVYRNGKNK